MKFPTKDVRASSPCAILLQLHVSIDTLHLRRQGLRARPVCTCRLYMSSHTASRVELPSGAEANWGFGAIC